MKWFYSTIEIVCFSKAEFQEMSEDERRVFIAELKDHVIIQSKEPEGEGEGEQGELIESHQLTDAAVEQLIIDGQVRT